MDFKDVILAQARSLANETARADRAELALQQANAEIERLTSDQGPAEAALDAADKS
jgi:hypothetical protein